MGIPIVVMIVVYSAVAAVIACVSVVGWLLQRMKANRGLGTRVKPRTKGR